MWTHYLTVLQAGYIKASEHTWTASSINELQCLLWCTISDKSLWTWRKAKIFHKITIIIILTLALFYLTLVLDPVCLHITCFLLSIIYWQQKVYHLHTHSQIFKHTLLYNSRCSHPLYYLNREYSIKRWRKWCKKILCKFPVTLFEWWSLKKRKNISLGSDIFKKDKLSRTTVIDLLFP